MVSVTDGNCDVDTSIPDCCAHPGNTTITDSGYKTGIPAILSHLGGMGIDHRWNCFLFLVFYRCNKVFSDHPDCGLEEEERGTAVYVVTKHNLCWNRFFNYIVNLPKKVVQGLKSGTAEISN